MLHPIEPRTTSSAVPSPAAPSPVARPSVAASPAAAAQLLERPPAQPAGEDSPWHTAAACRRDEVGLFFAPSKEPTAARLSREEQAKQVCARCPVLLACREHALAQPEPYGVWGGLTAAERRVVLARRRRRDVELCEPVRVPGARGRIAG
ncbi:WhiB family transcriptional regulator, redox-sensing transcriptional regulator [Streptomyces sp. TLI_053]|nr:WhiB family transcriptional regulator, redox-sensing transcriptional regulator [Streptomyces sp. TLI_053]